MIVASPALPIATPEPSSSRSSSTGSQEPSSGGDFASMLSASTGSGSGKSTGNGAALDPKASTSEDPEAETESGVETELTPGEQMTLAALLYAPQLTPVPIQPLKVTLESGADSEPSPAPFSYPGQPSTAPQTVVEGGEVSTNPVLKGLELPDGPAAGTAFQVAKAVPSATGGSTAPSTPAAASALPIPPPVEQPVSTPAEASAAPQTPGVSMPASESVSQVASGARSLEPAIVPNPPKADAMPAVKIAEAPVVEGETLPATSAAADPSPTLPQAVSTKTISATNTDNQMISEQPIARETPRGTASAKAVRDMKSSSTAQPESSTGSTPRPVTSDKGAQGEMTGDQQQDSSPAESFAAKQTGAEGFSVSTSAHAARAEASAKPMAAAPVTPTTVVHQLNEGMERIQQSGNNRMDLRLTLEGGGEVSIALQVRDGAVHASFQTNSPEMREALQKGWAQMAARSESLAIPLAEPVFKSSPNNNAGNSSQQQDPRERRQDQAQDQGQHQRAAFYQNLTAAPTHRVAPTAVPTVPARRGASGLNLYA